MSGRLVIFSAPSGSGKTTIVRTLLKTDPRFGFSISACTRSPRGNEIHGKDYYFLSVAEFEARVAKGDFVEWEEVYPGYYYGTLKSEIERLWSEDKVILFDVDVKGGLSIKKEFGPKAMAVFVKVTDIEVLKSRLSKRETDSEESIAKRLAKATYEMSFADQFDVILINEVLELTLVEARLIIDRFIESEIK
jgi:guanylate kinase